MLVQIGFVLRYETYRVAKWLVRASGIEYIQVGSRLLYVKIFKKMRRILGTIGKCRNFFLKLWVKTEE